MMVIPRCFHCIHLDRSRPGVMACAAFPAGIPEPILFAEVEHTRPYPGDHGIRYERDPHPPAPPPSDDAGVPDPVFGI